MIPRAVAGVTVPTRLRPGRVVAGGRQVGGANWLAESGAIAVQMDVTGEEDVRTAVKRIEAEHGGIDVLVNNAGFALWGAVEDIPLEDAR